MGKENYRNLSGRARDEILKPSCNVCPKNIKTAIKEWTSFVSNKYIYWRKHSWSLSTILKLLIENWIFKNMKNSIFIYNISISHKKFCLLLGKTYHLTILFLITQLLNLFVKTTKWSLSSNLNDVELPNKQVL